MAASPITPEECEVLFTRMQQAGWATKENLLWGYYFTVPDAQHLVPAVRCFDALGYKIVRVEPDDAGDFLWLHIEYFEPHTAKSLYARNEALAQLAEKLELRSYDGCDVRPLDVPVRHS